MAENSLAAHRRRIALALTALVLTACDQQEEAPREPVAAGAAVTLPPEPGCTTQIYNDHEYWFCPTDHTALEARALCAEQPWMHLVRIDDEDERDFLEGHFDGHAWIGGTDELTEGDWRWLDDGDAFWMGAAGGSPVAGRYADWVSGQPDNLTAVTPPAAMLTQLWDPDHASITDPVGSCTIHGWGDSAYWTSSSLL